MEGKRSPILRQCSCIGASRNPHRGVISPEQTISSMIVDPESSRAQSNHVPTFQVMGGSYYGKRKQPRSSPQTRPRSYKEATAPLTHRPAPIQALDPIAVTGAPGRSRTCDLRFRKLFGVGVRGSVCVLGSRNLAKPGKACPHKSFGKLQKKQQKPKVADALHVRTGIHVRRTPTSGGRRDFENPQGMSVLAGRITLHPGEFKVRATAGTSE